MTLPNIYYNGNGGYPDPEGSQYHTQRLCPRVLQLGAETLKWVSDPRGDGLAECGACQRTAEEYAARR